MASTRARLASFGLEDAKVSLSPTRSQESLGDPLETREPAGLIDPRSFPSMNKESTEPMSVFTVRLPVSTLRKLRALEHTLGVKSTEFVRDAIQAALNSLEGSSK